MGRNVNIPEIKDRLWVFGLDVQEGHTVLDSTRAFLRTGMGLDEVIRYVLLGYSGRISASEWTAGLTVQYDPAFDFTGIAIGRLPANLSSTLALAAPSWVEWTFPQWISWTWRIRMWPPTSSSCHNLRTLSRKTRAASRSRRR